MPCPIGRIFLRLRFFRVRRKQGRVRVKLNSVPAQLKLLRGRQVIDVILKNVVWPYSDKASKTAPLAAFRGDDFGPAHQCNRAPTVVPVLRRGPESYPLTAVDRRLLALRPDRELRSPRLVFDQPDLLNRRTCRVPHLDDTALDGDLAAIDLLEASDRHDASSRFCFACATLAPSALRTRPGH